MPFVLPPQYKDYKQQAKATGEPEGGGHILDFLWKTLSPETNRAWRKYIEGKYKVENALGAVIGDLLPDDYNSSLTGALPAGAMVKMGGKEYPNAFLHRAVGKPDELRWLENMWDKGKQVTKPTTINTPSITRTFEQQGQPRPGVLFNAESPSQLRDVYPIDLQSIPGKPQRAIDAISKLSKISEKYQAQRMRKRYSLGGDDPLNDKIEKYYDAVDFLHGKEWKDPSIWVKTKSSKSADDLDSLYRAQMDVLNSSPNSDIYSEAIANLDRNALAGVRLPLTGKIDQEIENNILSFAQRNKVPVYRWDGGLDADAVRQGLQDPFRGSWKWIPDNGGYYTPSLD